MDLYKSHFVPYFLVDIILIPSLFVDFFKKISIHIHFLELLHATSLSASYRISSFFFFCFLFFLACIFQKQTELFGFISQPDKHRICQAEFSTAFCATVEFILEQNSFCRNLRADFFSSLPRTTYNIFTVFRYQNPVFFSRDVQLLFSLLEISWAAWIAPLEFTFLINSPLQSISFFWAYLLRRKEKPADLKLNALTSCCLDWEVSWLWFNKLLLISCGVTFEGRLGTTGDFTTLTVGTSVPF